jgi:S1-C subfamily serine protease
MLNFTKITATLLATMVLGVPCVHIQAEEIAVVAASAKTTTELTVLPKLGFDSQLIAGYGEQVTYVEYGSKAFRLGLEEDDVILSLNDQRLTHRGAWQLAMREAVADGGVVTLKVRHARTGAIAVRHSNLLND